MPSIDSKERARLSVSAVDACASEPRVAPADPVNQPPHYTVGGIETRDYIAAKKLNFNRGCIVKYVTRAGLKDPTAELEDLEKARSYLEHEIARVKAFDFSDVETCVCQQPGHNARTCPKRVAAIAQAAPAPEQTTRPSSPPAPRLSTADRAALDKPCRDPNCRIAKLHAAHGGAA